MYILGGAGFLPSTLSSMMMFAPKDRAKFRSLVASQDFMTTIDYMYMSFKVGESHHLGNLNVYIVGHLSKEQLSEFCQLS